MNKPKIGIIGGDRRMAECASLLAEHGYETALCGFEKYEGSVGDAIKTDLFGALTRSAAVVLPLPVSRDGIYINAPYSNSKTDFEVVLSRISDGTPVFCGKPSEAFEKSASRRGITLIDYNESEAFQLMNAVPTAEGALLAVMSESDITVMGSKCLITGYGRIGKILARLLYFLGADVTVAARRPEERTKASILGISSVDFPELKNAFGSFDFIFNTVPFGVIGKEELTDAKSSAILVELASAPFGIDRAAAEEQGLKLIYAGGLPGKYAPITAGQAVAKEIEAWLSRK